MKINNGTVYLTDNGRALCGSHLGMTARASGRDISGQKIMAVTPEMVQQARDEFGYTLECETCGKVASAVAVRSLATEG